MRVGGQGGEMVGTVQGVALEYPDRDVANNDTLPKDLPLPVVHVKPNIHS